PPPCSTLFPYTTLFRSKSAAEALKHLAPWDAHLVKVEVHPNAPIVMKRLMDASLRTTCGVNIVAIKRGFETIVAPKPDERILPRDRKSTRLNSSHVKIS